MITDLASLLAPASSGDLVSAMLERRRLFVRTGDAERFADLLPWHTINTLFTLNRFAPDEIRVVQRSNAVPPAMYRDPSDASRLEIAALQSLAAQGVTVVINRIEKLVPNVGHLRTMMERHLRGSVWVNAYLSFRQQSAFRPHWDDHDFVIVHLHGRKRWRSWGVAKAFPAASHVYASGEAPGPLEWEEVLQPGDVLYMPRGEVHAAEVEEGGASAHLTVAVKPPRGADVVAALAAATDETLRMDVSPHWSEEELRRQEARLKATLHTLVDGLDLRKFLDQTERTRAHRTAANFGLIYEMDGGTMVRAAFPRRIDIPASRDGEVAFAIGKAHYRCSAAAAEILALVQERDAMRLEALERALTGRSPADLRQAVSELAQQGLVSIS